MDTNNIFIALHGGEQHFAIFGSNLVILNNKMYYLVDITIFRVHHNDVLQRIVKAKDKNTAYAKVDKYMREEWLLDPAIKYEVEVHDTIE